MPPFFDPKSIGANADNARKAMLVARQMLKNQITMGRRWIWNNPNGFTPQQMVTELGADASFMFAADAATTALLNQFKPMGEATFPSGLPAGWAATVNNATEQNPLGNGTVTLTPPSA